MRQDSIINSNEAVYADEHLSLDVVSRSVTVEGRKVRLTKKEYDLLRLMIQRAGEVIRRDALLMEIWSYGPDIRTRTLDVHVSRLRVKLGHCAERGIETVIGVGYRFQPRYQAQ
jgi:DNA-binding response OmpR family regulator